MKHLLIFLALTACAWSQPTMPFAMWKSAAAVSGYTFKPSDITSGTLKLWLYADTLKTLESKSVGDTLYRWQDISGNNYHMAQLTASLKPTLRDSATVWGVPGASVQFDGTDDYVASSVEMVDTTSGFTVFTVSRLVSFNGPYKGQWSLQTAWVAAGLMHSTVATYKDVTLGWSGQPGEPQRYNTKWTTYVPTTTHVLTVSAYGAVQSQAFARVDTSVMTRTASNTYPPLTNANAVGWYGSPGQTYNGHVMEHIVYSGVLPIGDIRKVEEYLLRKYSL